MDNFNLKMEATPNATLIERLHRTHFRTFKEEQTLRREAAARIAELEAGATNYERLLREQAAEISRPYLARIAELEAKLRQSGQDLATVVNASYGNEG